MMNFSQLSDDHYQRVASFWVKQFYPDPPPRDLATFQTRLYVTLYRYFQKLETRSVSSKTLLPLLDGTMGVSVRVGRECEMVRRDRGFIIFAQGRMLFSTIPELTHTEEETRLAQMYAEFPDERGFYRKLLERIKDQIGGANNGRA